MKTIKCLINVPDKYTGREYKAGEVYEFEDARADEILAARTRVTGEPFFVEVETEETPEVPEGQDANSEENAPSETQDAPMQSTEETTADVENVENSVETPEGQEGTDLEVGEMKEVNLEEMNVPELKELASKMNIEGISKMKKDELIEAIKNHD